MDKETYEALKEVIKAAYFGINRMEYGRIVAQRNIKQIENWIDEVAKEYTEEI